MLLIDGGRAVAGLCYVENLIDAALVALQHQNAPGQAFNVSDGLGVTWKQFTEDIAHGLGCAAPRLSMPYWISTAVGFSLEYSYRLLRGASGLTTPPLLSRQAVQVMGSDQDFSNRKARELLGWEPRVDYETGLRATIEWLQAEHFSHA
jgi:nucleoside-diphosphate-sugar epimerase